MQAEHPTDRDPISMTRAVRHHVALVLVCVLLGALAGWWYAGTSPANHTSVTRVLVNPSVGNPYAPTPSSVRQDELTSLETEAQVARSVEVLDAVGDQTGLSTRTLEQGLEVTVPPNTQVLEISFTAGSADVAQEVADAIATSYLDNRQQRFEDVNAARIERVADRTSTVVSQLRNASAATEVGTVAERAFQSELADALRGELVSLRAQRTALENSESPPGEVISPASEPESTTGIAVLALPLGGALLGLVIGCVVAMLLERTRGVVGSASEIDGAAIPVVAAVPPRGLRARLPRHRSTGPAFDTTIRRLRGAVLELEPRPDIVAVAPAGSGSSDADVAEAVAESFARAGHRVVLVQTDRHQVRGGLGVGERGLAEALLHERLDPLDLLLPSVDPLLSILPPGLQSDQSRELFATDRLRALLTPLVAAGNLVVVQAPGVDTAEGEALVGAADLGLIVVTCGVTRLREVHEVTTHARTGETVLGAVVVGRGDAARRTRRSGEEGGSDIGQEDAVHPGPTTERSSTRTHR